MYAYKCNTFQEQVEVGDSTTCVSITAVPQLAPVQVSLQLPNHRAQKKETPNSLLRKGAQNAVHVFLVPSGRRVAGALELPNLILSLTQLGVSVLPVAGGERETMERESRKLNA